VISVAADACVIELDDGTVTRATPDALHFDGAEDEPAQRP